MWIDDFFELFYSKDGEKVEKAYELKNQKMPNFLYKYKSIDDKGHTFDLLETDLLFLSDAKKLNDLYEGEFFYDNVLLVNALFDKQNIVNNYIEIAKLDDGEKDKLIKSKDPYSEMLKFVYSVDSVTNENISFEKFTDILFKVISHATEDIFKKSNDFSKENTYLTCFSKKHDLILMWSYYTDSNKGVCIK